jgi:DNA polymerase III subunit beta
MRVEDVVPQEFGFLPGKGQQRFPLGRGEQLAAKHIFILENRPLQEQIQRATDPPKRSLLLIFTKSNIDIVANTPEMGEAKESLAVMYQGREFSIAFNPEFLMAPLRNLSEEEIYLDLIDELSPGVIKIARPFLYVLMPVRL